MDHPDVSVAKPASTIATGTHSYQTEVTRDHCFRKTAHGGFLAAALAAAVRQHFKTTLKQLDKHELFNMHIIFLRSTSVGKAEIEIQDTKLGTGVTTLHATLKQNDKARVVAYILNAGMNVADAVSFETGCELWPAPRPAQLPALLDGSSPDWVRWIFPKHPKSVFLSFSHLHYYIPIGGSAHPSINDLWVTPADANDFFTTESLPLAADTWFRLGENFDPKSGYAAPNLADRARRSSLEVQDESELMVDLGHLPPRFLEATLSFTLEVKKELPKEGLKWLFIRARAKQIKDGRMDTEVVILNENFELLAISQHVTAIIDFPLGHRPQEAGQPAKAKI